MNYLDQKITETEIVRWLQAGKGGARISIAHHGNWKNGKFIQCDWKGWFHVTRQRQGKVIFKKKTRSLFKAVNSYNRLF